MGLLFSLISAGSWLWSLVCCVLGYFWFWSGYFILIRPGNNFEAYSKHTFFFFKRKVCFLQCLGTIFREQLKWRSLRVNSENFSTAFWWRGGRLTFQMLWFCFSNELCHCMSTIIVMLVPFRSVSLLLYFKSKLLENCLLDDSI